jgi:hypothetical protein
VASKSDLLKEASRILRSGGASAKVAGVPKNQSRDYSRRRRETAAEVLKGLPAEQRAEINSAYRDGRLSCQITKSYGDWLADQLEQHHGLSLQ